MGTKRNTNVMKTSLGKQKEGSLKTDRCKSSRGKKTGAKQDTRCQNRAKKLQKRDKMNAINMLCR